MGTNESGCRMIKILGVLLGIGILSISGSKIAMADRMTVDRNVIYVNGNDCPIDLPMRGFFGDCYSCEASPVYLLETECAKCPGRVMLESEKCIWCSHEDVCRCGKCVVRCSNAEFRDDSDVCRSCSDPNAYNASEIECAKCGNRFMKDGKCVVRCSLEAFRDNSDVCRSCSVPNAYNASEIECAKCGNRLMQDGKCVVRCSHEEFRDNFGVCRSCSVPNAYRASETECTKCGHRFMKDGECLARCSHEEFKDNWDVCRSCNDPKVYRASKTECAKCGNRLMQDGECYPCGYLENISTDASECKKCSNRKMKDGNCVLSKKVPNILIGLCLVVLLVMINIILIIK